MDHRLATASPGLAPPDALSLLGAGHGLHVPVHHELAELEALPGACLPLVIGRHRPDQVDAVVPLAGDEVLGPHVASIHELLGRKEVDLGQSPLGGADAVHFATAIIYHIPLIETLDKALLNLTQGEGNPVVAIRHPHWEGGRQFLLES